MASPHPGVGPHPNKGRMMYEIRVLKVSHPDLPWDWFTPVLYKDGKVHRVCAAAFGHEGADEHAMEWGMEEWEHLLD